MKIAIIGPAGAGKSTISKQLEISGLKIIEADKVVHEAYESNEIILRFLHTFLPECFVQNKVNRKILGSALFQDTNLRDTLEELFYQKVFVPILEELDNYVIDGLMPKFLKKITFDSVIYIHTPEEERVKRLLNRGVTLSRIKEIFSIQKNLFRDPINWNKNE
jgi:dephospho-CoA kinase